MARLTGLIVPDGQADGALAALSVAAYCRASLLDQPGFVEQRWPVAADGHYAIDLPDEALGDERTRIALLAASGEVVSSHTLSELADGVGKLKKIVLPKQFVPPPIEPPKPVPPGTARRLSGRLFRPNGGAVGKQAIRIYGSRQGENRFLVFSGATDASGYFAGMTSPGAFDAAEAEIGDSNPPVITAIPIAGGDLPQPLIIVDEAAAGLADDDHDCDCGTAPPATPDAAELAEHGEAFSTDLGGNCADFTVPNRTLEEFTFHRIVRTTDPEIRGLTLPDGVRDTTLLGDLFGATFGLGNVTRLLSSSNVSFGGRPADGPPSTETVALAMRSARQPAGNEVDREEEEPPVRDTPIGAYRDLAALEADGVAAGVRWDAAFDAGDAQGALREASRFIDPDQLHAALGDPDGFTPASLMMVERRGAMMALKAYLDFRRKPVPGRGALTEANPVDWDETPEFYQATSIAHGHILTFKQEWKADGYSLGELVKSLPLAPGQKKQIAIVDWDRRDTATRSESEDAAESLVAELSHERDINEIANAAFHENIKGGSEAHNEAIGGGFGLAIGPLVIGGGGGGSRAGSTSWQDSSRDMSGSTLNQLRDDTSQGASAVRSQRSTVIETVGQRERQTTTTEVIANHNRCHAVTIQYFEVLRHFAVQERIAGVRECLFIPLRMKLFDAVKALRWRTILTKTCKNRALIRNFDSIQRLSSPSTTPPNRSFADDPIEEISGSLSFRISITRPKDPDDLGKVPVETTAWRFIAKLLGISPQALYERYRRNDAKKDQIYREEIAPEAARKYLEGLQISLIDREGNQHDAGLGITVLSRYSEDGIMQIALNDQGASPRLTRRDIVGIEIRSSYDLPEFSKSVLESARFNYATERMAYWLVNSDRVLDDVAASDSAFLSTSALTAAEERNQLKEDRQRQRLLIKHLNANIEYYHRSIWLHMDANRRYMLLDGFEAPHSGGRSVASVVENRVIGVMGNALVMPVSPGYQLDPVLRAALKAEDDPQKVLENLYDVAPVPPRRLSVPTKGVFAESIMGKCDSCEVIEEDRFWRWTNYPLPDSPPPIAAVSTDSRYAAGGNLTPTAFPNAIVGFQTIPAAPLPTAMSAALGLLGKNVFKDLTGLTENQKNAAAALTTALSSSEAFAGEAFSLSMAEQASRNLDRNIDQIAAAKQAGYLTDDEASAATRDALLAALGKPKEGGTEEITKVPAVEKAVEKAADTPGGSATITRSVGDTTERVAFSGGDGGDLTIGSGGVPHVTDLVEEIWVATPAIQDGQDSVSGGILEVKRTRDVSDMFDLFKRPGTSNNGPIVFDGFEAAKNAKLVKADPADPTKVLFRALVRSSYPALASDKTRLAPPPQGTKYPVVFIIHGMAAGWELIPPFVAAGTAPGGIPKWVPKIKTPENHAGYDWLQDYLAGAGRDIVAFSIDMTVVNTLNSYTEMRAQMLLDAVQAIRDEAAKPSSPFHDLLDFSNVGLMGHSRGGEAVVHAYQLNLSKPAGKRIGIKAICSLAPTDFFGSAASPPVLVGAGDLSYLVVHGGLDGDVNGFRDPSGLDTGGTGMRIYDRTVADKAVAWIPAAVHDYFNTKWDPTVEWASPPSGALVPGDHLTLGKEYIGQFFDMVLNKDAALRSMFDNSKRNSVGTPVAISWKFGTIQDIDRFEGPDPGRNVPTQFGAVGPLTQLKPPAGASGRELHSPHRTSAFILDVSAVNVSLVPIEETFDPPLNISRFNLLTFRLGVMYPDTSSQGAIDQVDAPNFEVQLIDDKGAVNKMASSEIYKDLANGWAKPRQKQLDLNHPNSPPFWVDATQVVMQTITVDLNKLMAPYFTDATPELPINTAELKTLKIELQMPSNAQEVWIDEICLAIR